MTAMRIVEAHSGDLAPTAANLVFEYMAMTEGECGRAVPTSVDELPASLRAECRSLAETYAAPGVVLLACVGAEAVGCVGLKYLPQLASLEVKRFYVRPAHRGFGFGRALLEAAHAHAVRVDVRQTVLDVMPDRVAVVEFYRRSGYRETEPYQALTYPMVVMRRDVTTL